MLTYKLLYAYILAVCYVFIFHILFTTYSFIMVCENAIIKTKKKSTYRNREENDFQNLQVV